MSGQNPTDDERAAEAVRRLLDAFTALEALPSEEYPAFSTKRGAEAWHALAMAFNDHHLERAAARPEAPKEIGRASCRERV